MGLANWFCTFCSNIQVRNRDTISKRYKTITKRLNTDFWDTTSDTSHSLQVGSYGRNTAIHGTSDVDMIFQLPWALYKRYDGYSTNGQSALLQAVRNSARRTYSSTQVGADGQVTLIPFSGGMNFELVPGFLNDDDSYIYPDSNNGGSWKTTNPDPEIEAIRVRNKSCNNNLVPLCRMMRSWQQEWSVQIGGLLIDTLAYQFINNWKRCVPTKMRQIRLGFSVADGTHVGSNWSRVTTKLRDWRPLLLATSFTAAWGSSGGLIHTFRGGMGTLGIPRMNRSGSRA